MFFQKLGDPQNLIVLILTADFSFDLEFPVIKRVYRRAIALSIAIACRTLMEKYRAAQLLGIDFPRVGAIIEYRLSASGLCAF